MDSFSWTDGLRATVSTCLPCFSNRDAPSDSEAENEGRAANRGSQSHYEELEGLLGDVEETDGDAETMSLHSNLGNGQRRRKKKKRAYKTIRLFGLNLFGRPPPIQLSESEDEDGNDRNHSRRRRPGQLAIGQLGSAHSSSSAEAFDSDASPLDAAVISQLSPQEAAVRAASAAAELEAEEQRRREEREEKEERRRRRQERRELKRAAMAAALSNGPTMNLDGEEFEGFPGSGSLRPPFSLGSLASMASPPLPRAPVEEFGPYVGGSFSPAGHGDDMADGEADFGGEVYTRKARSRGSDSSRSHTHSQTSASRSNADSSNYYPQSHAQSHHHHLSQSSPLASPNHPMFVPGANGLIQRQAFFSPLPGTPQGPLLDASLQRKKKSKRSSNSATTSSKKSSSSPTSQSASLPSLDNDTPSPIEAGFTRKFAPSEPFIVEHGEAPGHALVGDDEGLKDTNDSKFPTVGFSGVRRMNSTGSGAFLARRGED